MSIKIGLISDVHSSPIPLKEALALFQREQVDEIICAGDIAGYFDTVEPTVELLREYRCRSVLGNHDQVFLQNTNAVDYPLSHDYLQKLPETLTLEISGVKIFVVHANPPSEQLGGIKLLDQQGFTIETRRLEWQEKLSNLDADVLIVGHTHQVYAEKLGSLLVINPGSSVFNHSCMTLTLPDLQVETFALENLEIVKCWRSSMQQH